MAPKQQKPASVGAKLTSLSKSPQFFWYLGHAFSVILFILLQVVSFFSRPWTMFLYRWILFFELVSYAIVAKQLELFRKASLKNTQLIHDENAQYLFFCVALSIASIKLGPWSKALYSFVIYSFFHAIVYFQSHILELLPIPLSQQAVWSDRITLVSTNYNQQALYFAAMNEVFLLFDFLWAVPLLVFKVFSDPIYVIFQAFLCLAVAIFLKLRYLHSTYSKTIIAQLDARISTVLTHPVVPPQLLQLYSIQFKGMVLAITDMIPVPTQVVKKTE